MKFRLPPPAFLLPAALRVAGLFTASPWYDELYTYHLVKQSPLEIVRLLTLDFNPPLWEFVLWLPMRIVPSVYTQRVIAVSFSLLALYLAWLLAEKLFPDKDLTSFAILLCAPGLLWQGQDGRVYALFVALYLAAILAALDRNWIRLGALSGLMLYAHGVGVVWVGSVMLFALVTSRNWKAVGLTGAAVGVAWLPWLPFVLNAKDDFYRYGLNEIDIFVNFGFTFWGGIFHMGLLVLGGVILVLTLVPVRNRWGAGWLVSWLPLVGIGVLSALTGANLFIYRVMQIALPTFLLHVWAGGVRKAMVAMTLIALAFWNPAARGGYLESVATVITEQWQEGDVIFAATGTAALPFAYELDGMSTSMPVIVWDNEPHPGLLRTEALDAFGFERVQLEDIPHARAWIITPDESLLTDSERTQIADMTAGGMLVGKVWYQQAAAIEIWLVSTK